MPVLKGLVAPLPVIFAVATLLLAPAGMVSGVWSWPSAWWFLATYGTLSLAGSVALAVARPASFKVRQQGVIAAREKRQPLIDAVGSVFYALCIAAWLAFIPVDVFRLRLLPAPPAPISAAGGAAVIAGVVIAYVAVAQNRFAAPTIHDQTQDGQRVIDTGLYAVVRHPFYAGMLIMTLARILIEEAYLKQTLPSYAGYARRVRSRLIPYLL